MSSQSLAAIPTGAFAQTLRVRSYEVERSGHIGIATILRYFESLATEASASLGFDFRWYEQNNTAWVVREMNVWLASLPGIGDEIVQATWVSAFRRVQAQREYLIRGQDGGRVVARASARWAYVDRRRGVPVRIPDELVANFPALGPRMPDRDRSPAAVDGAHTLSDELLLIAREYETDTQQHINNCVYGDWLAEGLQRALQTDASAAASYRFHPRAYQIQYIRSALPRTAIRVETVAYTRGARSLAVRQEVVDAGDGAVFVRATSTHVRLPR